MSGTNASPAGQSIGIFWWVPGDDGGPPVLVIDATPLARAEAYGAMLTHPLAFLRADLARTGHVGCADLARVRNGGQVEAAGLVLMRQKPGSAKGTMFITLEDEGGVANLIVWPGLFERQRGLVLSAGLLSCRGRVRHQGRVTHVVAEHLTDLTFWLRRIGELDLGRMRNERGDVVRHGGSPDLRDARPRSAAGDGGPILRLRDIFIPDLHIDGAAPDANKGAPTIRVRARDFR